MATRDDSRERQYTEENGHSLLGTAIKASAVVGAGALGWRYRREIGSGIREAAGTLTSAGVSKLARSAKLRETMEDVGTFARALNHAADSRGVLSHIKNPSRFQDRFDDSLQYSLEARARMKQTTLGGEPLQFLDDLKNMRNERKMVRQQVFESHRIDQIEKELNRSMPEFMEKGLMSQLSMRGQEWLYSMTKGKVQGFTDNLVGEEGAKLGHKISFANDEEKKKFQDSLFETLSKFESRRADGFTKNAELRGNMVRVERKARNAISEGYLERNKAQDDFRSKVMANAGFKRATNEDLIMHKNGNLLATEDRKSVV